MSLRLTVKQDGNIGFSSWITLGLCLIIVFVIAVGLARPAIAQAPEDKGTMIPTSDFPASEQAPTDEQTEQYCYDQYEPDDSMWSASWLYNGWSQRHAFCYSWDRDFVRFTARMATRYVIKTFDLDRDADTMLELYDSGGRLITQDDDGGGGLASRIDWVAPYNDTFYVLARQFFPNRVGPYTYYTIQMDEYSIRCQAIGCNNRVWVDRGCGAYYSIGQPIRVYMSVEADGYYHLVVSTDWGSRTLWSGYLNRGTYYLNGRVGPPGGAHTLTLYDGFINPGCTFYATHGPSANSTIEVPGDAADQNQAEAFPKAEPLEASEIEW